MARHRHVDRDQIDPPQIKRAASMSAAASGLDPRGLA
jgi:hypothetical protein